MMKKYLIQILQSKQAKRFYWNTLAGIVGLAITYFNGLDLWYAPLIIAALNGILKEINNRLQDLTNKK